MHPNDSVLGPLLYLPYPSHLLTATFADDTAVVATDSDPGIASQKLQTIPDAIQKWLKRWRIRDNESTSVHLTLTTRRETCPPVHINSVHLPQQEDVKYLGLHIDRRLTWRKHIFTKRKQLGMTLTKLHWLLVRKSKLFTSNELLIYKAILKPVWTYGIQLWGAASTSNTELLERLQSKVLRMIVDAPCYVLNTVIRTVLQKHQQLKKKSVITALNTVRGSVYIQET
jgi:hypothetical protein